MKRSATRLGLFAFLIMAIITMVMPRASFGGGTSENLILVVNAESAASKKIANHYIHWRKIPRQNVIYLSGIGEDDRMPIDQFREKILKPVIATIQNRKIAAQVDYIVYSTGFPTRILVDKDIANHPEGKKIAGNRQLRNQISITSATYYLQSVMQKKLGYLSLSANWYMRTRAEHIFRTPLMGPDADVYKSALQSMNSGSYGDAVTGFQNLADKYGDNYLLWYQVARCYAQENKPTESAMALNHAIRHGFEFRSFLDADKAFDQVRENSAFTRIRDLVPDEPFEFMPTQGFRSRYAWQPNGIRAKGTHTGRKYFLSTMLAHTGGGGVTEEQALKYLEGAVQADVTHPKGAFYFAKTSDVRTKTRLPNFEVAISALRRAGHKAEVVESILPSRKQDIMGCSIGVSKFQWAKANSRILPGAICENLTSYGGLMSDGNKQTNLSEFLRNGAAGSSGTVIEPYAIQAKFPHPMIHAHYVNGVTLAEAFYQSVHGPFQLLIVGDALCRPYANPQKFTVKGLEPNQEVKGKIEIEIAPGSEQDKIAHFELFTDGVFRSNLAVGRKVVFDSSKMTDGHHEIRIVAVEDSRIESKSRMILPFVVNNSGTLVELTCKNPTRKLGENFDLELKAKDAKRIQVFQNGRVVASVDGGAGRISLSSETLGSGPTVIYAIAEVGDKPYQSAPVELKVNE